jgi:Tol biopolymer transport system component
MQRRRHALVLALVALGAVAALGASSAFATYPGQNGRIAFSNYVTGQLYSVNPDGSARVRLTSTGPKRGNDTPSWSPDGKRLLFTIYRNADDDHSRIWVMHADGSHKRKVAPDSPGFHDYNPQYTPDEKHIVFTRCQPDDGVCAIWKMRADGTHKRALTPYVHSPHNEHIDFDSSISPDGRRIAFARFAGGGFAVRLFLMRADGSNPHPVTPARLEAGAPDWAPDGRRIVFNSNTPRAGSSLFTMKPGGDDIRRLTQDRFPHSDAIPSYSPQGDRIAFISDRNYPDVCCNELFEIGAGGGGEELIDTGLPGPPGILFPAWGTAPLH